MRALGYTKEDLLAYFYDIERVFCKEVDGEIKWFKETPLDLLLTQLLQKRLKSTAKLSSKRVDTQEHIKLDPLITKGQRFGAEKEIDVVVAVSREYLYPMVLNLKILKHGLVCTQLEV